MGSEVPKGLSVFQTVHCLSVAISMSPSALSGDAKLGTGGSRGDIGRVDHHANRHP